MSDANQERQERTTAVQGAPALTILAAEALRGAAAGPRPADPAPAKGEERLSLFWRVFGGTLLSIAALVVVTLYQQFASSINDLRHDIARLNEADANLVKKDEFNARTSSLWSGLNDAKGANAGLAAVREKQTLQEQQLKQAEDERKELLRTVQTLRDRVTTLEARQGRAKPTKTTGPDIPD
jgi:hypothetical protein